MQDLSGKVQAGQAYTLTARIKYENPSGPVTKQFFATMHYGGTYTSLVSVTATKGQWAVQRDVHHPFGAERLDGRLFFETRWTSTSSRTPTWTSWTSSSTVSVIGAETESSRVEDDRGRWQLPGTQPLDRAQVGPTASASCTTAGSTCTDQRHTGLRARLPLASHPDQLRNINQITVISSEDLVNWTDHGEIQVAGPTVLRRSPPTPGRPASPGRW